MEIGLHLTRFNWPEGDAGIGPRVAAIARRAEEAGFDGLWPMDHFFQIPLGERPAEEAMLEGYTVLTFAAAVTERIQLGTLVTGVSYRHPGVLLKTVTTLDVLSGGRAWLGIGAAWNEREHLGLGVPFPPLAERFERLEETLQIANQMWSDDVGPYTGRHYQLAETLNQPMPLSRPRPRILIGGGGEQKTFRLVARYADACNLFDTPELPRKLEVLRERCAEIGRPYEEILKTVSPIWPVTRDGADGTMTPDQVDEQLARLADLGVDQAVVMVQEPLELATIDLFGERIIPDAAKLVPRGRERVTAGIA
jgi:F420-dependent oxidoreductase-like protein